MKNIFLAVLLCAVAIIVSTIILYFFLKFYNGHNRFLLFLRYKIFKINVKHKSDAYYSIKPSFVSPCEMEYLNVIKSFLKPELIIVPQVPLSQIIEKHSSTNYKNELFRVVDFCIFDSTYYPLLCVEINDTTHLKKDRAKRDSKVSQILQSARLPLLSFWTYEGINQDKIKKSLKQYNLA